VKGSRDVAAAKVAARALSLDLEVVEIDPRKIPEEVRQLMGLIRDSNPINISVALPIWHAARRAAELGFEVGIAGQGADELFGGYHRYLSDLDPEGSMLGDLHGLHARGLDAFTVACRANGLDLFLPYLDPRVVYLALSLPVTMKISEGERKVVLREAGRTIGLKEDLVSTRKLAIQYGSGVNKHVLRALGR
jgi:asparagine synthase (glutamine-hydrolysing)